MKLLKDTQEFLHRMRVAEQDVGIYVSLSGIRSGKHIFELSETSKKMRVPKLPI